MKQQKNRSKNSTIRKYIRVNSINPNNTASNFVGQICNLSQQVEDLSLDGQKASVKKIGVYGTMLPMQQVTDYNNVNDPFLKEWVIMQTAGNMQTSVSDANSTDYEAYGAMTDDVFGIQRIGNPKISAPKPSPVYPAAATESVNQGMQFIFNIPRNVIDLLNKEAETERLQNLYLLDMTRWQENQVNGHKQQYKQTYWLVVDYVLTRKAITIR